MKKTRILSLVMALVMLMSVSLAGAESLNLAELPLTTEEGATVSILAINSYYSNVDLTDATLLKEIADRAGVTIDWHLIDPSSYADSVSPMLASGQDLADVRQTLPGLLVGIRGGQQAPQIQSLCGNL